VKIIRSLFENERTTFNGRYYSVHDALLEPKPVQQPLPIWIGGAGEQLTLRVVAESADGWNTFFMPPEDYRTKLDVLAAHCKDTGRDPADIRKSLAGGLLVGETEAEVAERAAELGAVQRGIAGTPEQCIEQLLEYVRLGVGDFLFSARPPVDFGSLELFQKHVAPAVRTEGAKLLAAG
jgi:alkanesulfonate monooxygenase SsuD/methylene tetrahydromethanopterin reductase-like flavin-dependent oxidoreductase (luciferase family)